MHLLLYLSLNGVMRDEYGGISLAIEVVRFEITR